MPPISKAQLAKRRGKSASSRSAAGRPPSGPSPCKGVKRHREKELSRQDEPDSQLVFDDPHGDDYEQEVTETQHTTYNPNSSKPSNVSSSRVIFQPGKHSLSKDETLVCDESAYDVFYKCNVEWPALSFDYICTRQDGEFDNSNVSPINTYPLSVTLVLGTQADKDSNNKLVFIRMTNLHRNSSSKSNQPGSIKPEKDSDDDTEDESDPDEEEDEEDDCNEEDPSLHQLADRNAILQSAEVKVDSTVNRVRVMPQRPGIVAYWTESGRVSLVDAFSALNTLHLDSRSRMQSPTTPSPSSIRPFFTIKLHGQEGFALNWSRVTPGRLLSGAMNGSIFLSQSASEHGSSWVTNPDRFRGHRSAVEDLQWSPNERDVFASCASDKSIRVWDVREYRKPALGVGKAHDGDVNVISWNHRETHLLGSGGDDGIIKVWDLRSLKNDPVNDGVRPAAEFAMHQQPITAVQWHPVEASMLCASSEDGSVSVWDLAVERDAEEEVREGIVVDGAEEYPPQMLFIHMGQHNVKDAQWHPACQSLIVSTAEDGLNVFQPSNIVLPQV